ncbi:MAG: hypothetical protein AD742_17045 [Methylibium sp. NZG]|nr:MAG: hypothetical protein AD742_17045 [Methylibium sp. NZG]
MGIVRFFKRLAFPGTLLVAQSSEGTASGLGPTDWSVLRAPLTDADRVLLSETHVWLRSVPRAFHPRQFCLQFPRAANRLAKAWHDPVQVDRLLTDLLSDHRGDRTGFPPRIVDELKLLRQYHEHPREAWQYVLTVAKRAQPTRTGTTA